MSLMLLGHVHLAEGNTIRAEAVLAEAGSLFQATGNMVYLPWCLEGLASLAAAQGDYGRAAGYRRALEVMRASMTLEAVEAVHARLAGQPPPQIVAAALGTRDSPPSITEPG